MYNEESTIILGGKGMNQKWYRKAAKVIMADILLAAVLLVGSLSACGTARAVNLEHGTTDKKITESMLANTPPADYEIDKTIQGDAKDGKYNEYFLKDAIQTVSIDIDENNLNYLLQNAGEKPTVMTKSVTIGDKTLSYTGLKTKGNYTLQHAVTDNPGSDRFSFTINFGKYIKKSNGFSKRQNFFGCHKISFNNFYFDKSMMKEYIAMKLMTEMGLPTPQYGLAKLYINQKYYGVYFMVEALDSSILEQYKGVEEEELSPYLTKPEESTLEYDTAMDRFMKEDGTFDLSSVLKQDSNGVYTASGELEKQSYFWEDDEETLQDVAEMMPTVLGWQRKLTLLSQGKDFQGNKIDVNSDEYLKLLEEIMDVDETVRYFAAHSWLVQLDDMFVVLRNMGLYIGQDGKSMMLPWDYDLSFGCYYPSMSETAANMHIDLMYKDDRVAFSDQPRKKENLDYSIFPFFQVIYQNDSLMEKYHQYMKDCSKIAALGGTTTDGKTYEPCRFVSGITKIEDALIKAADEKLADNVYYLNLTTQPADVKAALPNLKKIIALRALGVLLQVDEMDAVASGYGCNLETLGNAVQGMNSNRGRLAAIDESTGIYSVADYGGSRSYDSPSLRLREVESGELVYQKISKQMDSKAESMKIYTFMDTASANGDYTLYIPAGTKEFQNIQDIYSYDSEGGLKKLEVKKEEDRYCVVASSIDYLVFTGIGEKVERTAAQPVAGRMVLVAAGIVLVAAAAVIMVIRRKRRALKKV